MFKEIFQALTAGDQIDRAFSQLVEMLDHAKWMFVRANDVLQNIVPAEEVKDSIYTRDQAVNELERSIRRKILRHLTINPGDDVAACLALMSVAKDAERIGDYCKNVFEVGRFYTKGFHHERYHDVLEEIREQTGNLFDRTAKAFRDSNEKLALKIVDEVDGIRDRCDEVIESLLSGEEQLRMHEAVAYSLLARHYKRVAAHLGNIATAALGRLDDLDFGPD
jgi:phosphate transport system protein